MPFIVTFRAMHEGEKLTDTVFQTTTDAEKFITSKGEDYWEFHFASIYEVESAKLVLVAEYERQFVRVAIHAKS